MGLAVLLLSVPAAHAVPSIEDLSGNWINTTGPVSAHVDGADLDLPIVSNFWGHVGSAPSGVRPVDMFAINSLELPPFVGCGALSTDNSTYGCGRLLVDGEHLAVTSTRFQADEIGRRSLSIAAGPSAGLLVASATRMVYEQNAIIWQLNFTNPTAQPLSPEVTFELSAMVQEVSNVRWVQPIPFSPASFRYTALPDDGSGLTGVMAVGTAAATATARPATAIYTFAGAKPDRIDVSAAVPRAVFHSLSVPAHSTAMVRVALSIGRGTDGAAARALAAAVGATAKAFDDTWAAAHDRWQARWQAAFEPTPEAADTALGNTGATDAGGGATDAVSGTVSGDGSRDFSGSLPTLELDPSDVHSAGVERVYYTAALSVLSLLRTNLPLVHDKVFTTSQGSTNTVYAPKGSGGVLIGGAASYYWDESLSSMLVSLLEPAGRAPTLQAWLTSDLRGRSNNLFQLDCGPPGSVTNVCNFTDGGGVESAAAADSDSNSDSNIYPYNIWSYAHAIVHHLRVNNDRCPSLLLLLDCSCLTAAPTLTHVVIDRANNDRRQRLPCVARRRLRPHRRPGAPPSYSTTPTSYPFPNDGPLMNL
jgi:hypothetical protein